MKNRIFFIIALTACCISLCACPAIAGKGLGINKISHHPEIYCRESVRDKYFFQNP